MGMLDDLREQAGDESAYEEEEIAPPPPRSSRFLGMTAVQRFILSVMLLVITCMMGSLFLLVTEKLGVPVF